MRERFLRFGIPTQLRELEVADGILRMTGDIAGERLQPFVAPAGSVGHHAGTVAPRSEVAGLQLDIAVIRERGVTIVAGIFGGAGERQRDAGMPRRLLLGLGEQKHGAREITTSRVRRAELVEHGGVLRLQAQSRLQCFAGARQVAGPCGGPAEIPERIKGAGRESRHALEEPLRLLELAEQRMDGANFGEQGGIVLGGEHRQEFLRRLLLLHCETSELQVSVGVRRKAGEQAFEVLTGFRRLLASEVMVAGVIEQRRRGRARGESALIDGLGLSALTSGIQLGRCTQIDRR